VFAICWAFLGIPAFLLSVIGLGKLLNLGAEALIRALSRLCRRGDDDDEHWPEDGRPPSRMPRAARQKFFRRRGIYRYSAPVKSREIFSRPRFLPRDAL